MQGIFTCIFPLLIEAFGASDEVGSLLHNKPFDYVMARPERTDVRARHSLLSGDYLPLWGLRGIPSWSLMTLERSGKGLSLQTAVC